MFFKIHSFTFFSFSSSKMLQFWSPNPPQNRSKSYPETSLENHHFFRPKRVPKWLPNRPQNHSKSTPETCPKNHHFLDPKMGPKWPQNGPPKHPKAAKRDPNIEHWKNESPGSIYPFALGPKWLQNGTKMSPKCIIFEPQMLQKWVQNRIKIDPIIMKKNWQILVQNNTYSLFFWCLKRSSFRSSEIFLDIRRHY